MLADINLDSLWVWIEFSLLIVCGEGKNILSRFHFKRQQNESVNWSADKKVYFSLSSLFLLSTVCKREYFTHQKPNWCLHEELNEKEVLCLSLQTLILSCYFIVFLVNLKHKSLIFVEDEKAFWIISKKEREIKSFWWEKKIHFPC